MKNVDDKWTVQDMPLQEGRLAVVTGATSGIGFHSAKELARKGATVIMPARDMRRAKEAAERIEAEVPKAQLYLAKLDLAEQVSRPFRRFSRELQKSCSWLADDARVSLSWGTARQTEAP